MESKSKSKITRNGGIELARMASGSFDRFSCVFRNQDVPAMLLRHDLARAVEPRPVDRRAALRPLPRRSRECVRPHRHQVNRSFDDSSTCVARAFPKSFIPTSPVGSKVGAANVGRVPSLRSRAKSGRGWPLTAVNMPPRMILLSG